MTSTSPLFRRLAILVAAGTLAACSVETDQRVGYDPRPDPFPDESRICTREYAPVCGASGRDRQTFANACEARMSGFDVIGRGECLIRRPDRDRIDGDRDDDRVGWRDRDGERGDRDRNDRNDRDWDRDRDRTDRDFSDRDRDRADRDRPGRDRTDDDRERGDRNDRVERERPRDRRNCAVEFDPRECPVP